MAGIDVHLHRFKIHGRQLDAIDGPHVRLADVWAPADRALRLRLRLRGPVAPRRPGRADPGPCGRAHLPRAAPAAGAPAHQKTAAAPGPSWNRLQPHRILLPLRRAAEIVGHVLDGVTGLGDHREELAVLRPWLMTERFDRRALNRALGELRPPRSVQHEGHRAGHPRNRRRHPDRGPRGVHAGTWRARVRHPRAAPRRGQGPPGRRPEHDRRASRSAAQLARPGRLPGLRDAAPPQRRPPASWCAACSARCAWPARAGGSAPAPLTRAARSAPWPAWSRERTTPELQYLEAKFAGLVSYGLSAKLLAEVLPLGRPLHATAVRRHTQAVAQRLEDELGEERWSFIDGCPSHLGRAAAPGPAARRRPRRRLRALQRAALAPRRLV